MSLNENVSLINNNFQSEAISKLRLQDNGLDTCSNPSILCLHLFSDFHTGRQVGK